MSLHDHSVARDEPPGSFLTSRAALVLIGFIVLAGALLLTEHRAHVLGALLWLLPLACLFMHFFKVLFLRQGEDCVKHYNSIRTLA